MTASLTSSLAPSLLELKRSNLPVETANCVFSETILEVRTVLEDNENAVAFCRSSIKLDTTRKRDNIAAYFIGPSFLVYSQEEITPMIKD
jgi:hypothetical protein